MICQIVGFPMFLNFPIFFSNQSLTTKEFLVTYWYPVGAWWRFGRVDAFRPNGHGFDFHSSCHVGTLGKSFTHSCLWRFGVKFRHSIRAVSGALLSSRGLEEAL